MQIKAMVFAGSWPPRVSSRSIQNLRLFSELKQWEIDVFTIKRITQITDESGSPENPSHISAHHLRNPPLSLIQRLRVKLGNKDLTVPDGLPFLGTSSF